MRTCACARAPQDACARAARWLRPAPPTGLRVQRRGTSGALAAFAQPAQLEQVPEDAVARVAADVAEGALERVGVELARAAASRADDGVMAPRGPLALCAGPH